MTNNYIITTKDIHKKSNCITLETKILGNFTIDDYDDFSASKVMLGINCTDPNNLILHTYMYDENAIKLKTWREFDYCDKLDFYHTPVSMWMKKFITGVYSNMTRFLYYRYNSSCKFAMTFITPKVLDSRYVIYADADIFSSNSCMVKITVNDSKLNNYVIQKFTLENFCCEEFTIDDIEYIVRELVAKKLNTELDSSLYRKKENDMEE